MFRANIEDVVGFGLLQESALFNIENDVFF